jgi:hypothetical protein
MSYKPEAGHALLDKYCFRHARFKKMHSYKKVVSVMHSYKKVVSVMHSYKKVVSVMLAFKNCYVMHSYEKVVSVIHSFKKLFSSSLRKSCFCHALLEKVKVALIFFPNQLHKFLISVSG